MKKKKTISKILSFLLVLVLTFSSAAAAAMADENSIPAQQIDNSNNITENTETTDSTVDESSNQLDELITTQSSTPSVSYATHVQNVGWQDYVSDGKTAGTTGKSLRLEGIKIKLDPGTTTGSVTYRTHIQNIGWQKYVTDNALSGTSGRSLRLEGISIKLTGNISSTYSVYYRVHAQNFGWLNWAHDGELSGTAGYSYRLEAIQIKLVAKGSSAPGETNYAFKSKGSPYSTGLSYTTHVQNIGWQEYTTTGNTAGTTGQSLRLESIKISGTSVYLNGKSYNLGIQYKTHIQNIGWTNWVSDNKPSGTTGRSLRLEAIQIKLTGDAANNFDIYYRVHAQNYGWLDWAKNGNSAGTEGFSYRLEGIQIVLVKKGSGISGDTAIPFVKKASVNLAAKDIKLSPASGITFGSNCDKLWRSIYKKYQNNYSTAALCGNIMAESNINSQNLQNSFNTAWNVTDADYTSKVDNNTYRFSTYNNTRDSFSNDRAGYGLCQWTSSNRKQGLYDLCKKNGTSIGSMDSQVAYLITEIAQKYPTVNNQMYHATSVWEASNYILHDFEIPASMFKSSTYTSANKYSLSSIGYNVNASSSSKLYSLEYAQYQSKLRASYGLAFFYHYALNK